MSEYQRGLCLHVTATGTVGDPEDYLELAQMTLCNSLLLIIPLCLVTFIQ